MDLTVYLFDTTKALRAVITRGIVQLIHKERARTLSAEIPVKYEAKPGEYLGFTCVDGRFRMFAIDYADDDDTTATTIITATDAAKDELTGAIVAVTEQENIAIAQAAEDMLTAIGWQLGKDETEGKTTALEGGLRGAWDVLSALETDGNLFVDPYYEFDGKAITGRVVDLAGKKPVYVGRLVQRGTDAENIVITRKNRPRPMIFPQGEDGLTIADAVWSKENGDPVNKPAGQLWIGAPEAVAKYPGQGQVLSVATDDPAELMRKGWEAAQKAAEPSMTATALISDMEMIAGQSWKSIRLFYIVRVRPRFGQDAEAQTIEIARNYVRNDETKITLGEEPDSSANQIRKLAKTTAANVRELGKYKAQWKDMLVTVEELEEYTRTTVTEAWLDLKASTDRSFAQIGARLDNTDAQNEIQFRTLSEAILTLDTDMDEALARIGARFEQSEGTTQEISQALAEFKASADEALAQISARFEQSEGTTQEISQALAEFKASADEALAQIGARFEQSEGTTQEISQALAEFKASADEALTQIGARFEQGEGETQEISRALAEFKASADGAVAMLEARIGDNTARISATATELGTRIELKADVTYVQRLIAEEIEAAIGDINYGDITSLVTEYLVANTYATFNCPVNVNGNILMSNHDLTASGISAQSFRYKGNLIAIKEHSLMTGGKVTEGSTYANYPVYKDGVQIGSVNIPSTWKFTPTYGTKVSYLGTNTSED